jgi:hypothetical protein
MAMVLLLKPLLTLEQMVLFLLIPFLQWTLPNTLALKLNDYLA